MIINFYKYQGTGNDFIMIDNMSGECAELTVQMIVQLCNRKFGIGADGLIRINPSKKSDFEVDYYNSDGSKSFCGNGARCAVRFVNDWIMKKERYVFDAIDGVHTAEIDTKLVFLEMKDVSEIKQRKENTYELNTGSPHFIRFEKDIDTKDMVAFGRSIRYNKMYNTQGINVNWVEVKANNQLFIRTYERGVEDETLSCGTGITAAAIAFAQQTNLLGSSVIHVRSMGGDLEVKLKTEDGQRFHSIQLIGPAVLVFNGIVHV